MESLIRNIFRYIVPSLLVVFLAIVSIFKMTYFTYLLSIANTFAIYVISWNLLAGYAGQLSIGHALFFGLAAYASAILTTVYGFPLLLSPLIWVAVGLTSALIVGTFYARLSGPYLAIATLIFAEIAWMLSHFFTFTIKGTYTVGAEEGIPVATFGTYELNYYLSLGVMLVVLIFTRLLLTSQIGLRLMCIRDDEVAAESIGIDINKYKILAFTISGLLASIAGGIHAHAVTRHVSPVMFSVETSFEPIIATVMGGIGTLIGPIIAAYVLTLVFYYFPWLHDVRLLLYSVILMVLVIKKPFWR